MQHDLTVYNGTVLTMDRHNTVLEDGWVGVKGDTITRVGTGALTEAAASSIDAKGGLILPGLVNGHTHAAMSLFRGLADDLPLMEWLNGYIFPVERNMDADFVRAGTLLACAEMIMSGTTTFCDMYLFEDEVAHAARDAGLRCVLGEVLYDFPSPNYGEVKNGIAYTKTLIESWRDDPLVSVAVEPHSLYTCSPQLLSEAHGIARDYGVPLIIHVAETAAEISEVRDRYGKHPVDHLHGLGLLGPDLIASHCVHLNERHLKVMAEHGVSVVTNPESNMKLASGVAPVPEMMAAGITVGLGTDGCASNNDLDMFAEMDTVAKLHKVNCLDPTVTDAVTVLRMATIEGARALGLDGITGSVEDGKKADLIVVDTDKPHLTPLYNPYSHLVYSARGQDVSHTIINGRVVMDRRTLLSLDLDAVMARARDKARLVRRWVS